MKQVLFEDATNNFRISHISRSTPYSMDRMHLHIEYEIYYLMAGERYYFIDDQTYFVSAGSLVLVPSGRLHRTDSCPSGDTHERILLILQDEWINPFLNKTGLAPLEFYFSGQPVIQLSAAQQKQAYRLFDDIYSEVSYKLDNFELAIKMKLAELLILISRCTASPNISSPVISQTSKHKNVSKATFYIKNNFKKAISLQEVADYVYVSRGYLSNIFNEVTGMKITEYINLQRINYAKQLLADSSASITFIAEDSGFGSITYFEKQFQKLTGMSPIKYRQSLNSEQEADTSA